jgi:hypothetical protein
MLMRRTILAAALVVCCGVFAVATAGAQAATLCTGLITDQTIVGGIEVPTGSPCALMGVTVLGNVKIDPGAAFSLGFRDAPRGNTVTGNITGTNIDAFDSDVPGSTIGGSIILKGVTNVPYLSLLATLGLPDLDTDGADFFTALDVHGATSISFSAARWDDDTGFPSNFRGGLTWTDNPGFLSMINGDTVGAAMELKRNTGGGELDGLTIAGSLACGNSPQLTIDDLTVTGHDGATSPNGGLC